MSHITVEIGKKIVAFREQKGLTQTALGQKAGLTQPAICQIEKGKRHQIHPQHLERIASVLGVSLFVLLGQDADNELDRINNLSVPLRRLLRRLASLPLKEQEKLEEIIIKILDLP